MPSRYNFPRRFIYQGDEALAQLYTGRASVLLADLVSRIAGQKGEFGKRRVVENDVVFDLSFAGNVAQAVITVAPVLVPNPNDYSSKIWIPRGFVVYPANDDAPFGWGLPIIQRANLGDTPYS